MDTEGFLAGRGRPGPAAAWSGGGLESLPRRWAPAHHRVLQYVFLCTRHAVRVGGTTAPGQPYRPRPRTTDRPGQRLCQGRRGRPGQGAEGTEAGRHPRVGAVQQPRHRQRGERVHGRHRRSGVVPGMAAARRRGQVAAVRPVRRRAGVRVRQRQVQHSLRRQRDGDGGGRGVAAPGEGPDRQELPGAGHPGQSPRHRARDDLVVSARGQHGAEHGEQPGPPARPRTAGPLSPGTCLVPGHLVTRHVRPSSSGYRRSAPSVGTRASGPKPGRGVHLVVYGGRGGGVHASPGFQDSGIAKLREPGTPGAA